MMLYGWVYYLFFFTILVLLVKPLGNYMAKVFQGENTFLSRWVTPLEGAFYRFTTIDPSDEMDWKMYTKICSMFQFFRNNFSFPAAAFSRISADKSPINVGGAAFPGN